jgi:trehalose synthase-fused probable maltokinase
VTVAERIRAGDFEVLDERTLIDFVRGRRWFGAKTQEVAHARMLDGALLRREPPLLASVVAEIRFGPGTHELYQLVLGLRPEGEWTDEVIAETDGWTVYDALVDPELSSELGQLIRGEATFDAADGAIEFRRVEGADGGDELGEPRPVGVEQSNTSVIFGSELVLKVYRRIEAGVNPELELLRFLTERGFPHIAALAGWYAYEGRVMDATLGILQRYVAGGRDGWEIALEELRADPEAFLSRLRRLGEVTGELHSALATDPQHPDFCPEQPSFEAIALLTASVDEEIEDVFLNLPDDFPALDPIRGRGEEVRERLRQISQVGAVGRVIRHHGDYHLGQVLWDGADWIVLDFEGEPARPLHERRRKRSPLRDVAGMLRSFAYAASASQISHGVAAPEGWEGRARDEFLGGYFSTVERSLVPSGSDATNRLLSVFELEKAVYELRYELNNRPDWVGIPVAGILRLLES